MWKNDFSFFHISFLSAVNGQRSAADGNQFLQIDFKTAWTVGSAGRLPRKTHGQLLVGRAAGPDASTETIDITVAVVQSQFCWFPLAVDRWPGGFFIRKKETVAFATASYLLIGGIMRIRTVDLIDVSDAL